MQYILFSSGPSSKLGGGQKMKAVRLLWQPSFYRPQTKFAKVMLLHLSVSHSVHGGSTWAGTPRQVHPPWQAQLPGRYTPSAGTPPPRAGTSPRAGTPPSGRYTPQEQCMLGDTGNKWAVRILLECILVCDLFSRGRDRGASRISQRRRQTL